MGYLDVLKIKSSIVASLYDRVRRVWVVCDFEVYIVGRKGAIDGRLVCDLEICRETGKQVEFKYLISQLL